MWYNVVVLYEIISLLITYVLHRCNICGKRFHVPNSLRSHLQIHAKGGNNIHYCKLCNREFATDARFEKHLKFKHPAEEEDNLCSQCGKKFCSRSKNLLHSNSCRFIQNQRANLNKTLHKPSLGKGDLNIKEWLPFY